MLKKKNESPFNTCILTGCDRYCDCFANGEFCSNCNCVNCSNNMDHEKERSKAIKVCEHVCVSEFFCRPSIDTCNMLCTRLTGLPLK